MISLENFGWNETFQNYKNNCRNNLNVGRVVSIQGYKHTLITETGEMEAELSGKLLFASAPDELPKVGDWVFFMVYDPLGYIIEILPRENEVFRKTAGKKNERQILAVNIDFALIVQGLDRDFNLMRLERYLVQMAICNIQCIVVLNKADLVENTEDYSMQISRLNRDCPVYFCSTYTGLGIESLKNEVLTSKKTYIMIGSSGVGKSSLLNALMPQNPRAVNELSDSTGKGRHTTTTRDLFRLQNGSLLIDTPGMREFGMAMDEEQTGTGAFPTIDNYAVDCRFTDCKHINEAGCGVIDALENGKISVEVYESYLKLIKEQRRFEIKAGEQKKLGKQFGKMVREAKEYRKKYKF